MAKIVKAILKLQIQAQQATPGQAIGPVLGQHGVNIQEFCKQFNDASKDMGSDIIPVNLTVYEDRSFSIQLRTPPASDLLRKAAGIEKGSGVPNKNKVGSITKDQARQIAERKMEDLNAIDVEAAVKIVTGTARSMGIEVE